MPASASGSSTLEDEAENVAAAPLQHVDCCQKRTRLSPDFADTPIVEVEVEVELRARFLL